MSAFDAKYSIGCFRAARQLMFDRSLDDARVEDITNLADVGKGTFFNFFAAKELVLPEIMRDRVRLVRESIDQVKLGQASSREVLDYFINSGIERKQAPADRHNLYDSFLRSMAHDERVRRSISDIVHEAEQLAGDLVKSGQASGEFRRL